MGATTTTNRKPAKRASKKSVTLAVIPDLQVWCWPDHLGAWHTCHDEAGIDAALAALRAIDAEEGIDEVIQIGDACEMANFSPFRTAPALTAAGAWQRSQKRTHEILSLFAEATPRAQRRTILDSNHLWKRVLDALQKASRTVAGLGDLVGTTFADDAAAALPILAPERLFGYESAGWTTTGNAYPQDRLWLTPTLALEHGTRATRDPEKALREYLAEIDANIIVGHMLTSGTVTATRTTARGTQTVFAHSVGTLQRLDGACPSENQGVNVWGEPTLGGRGRGDQGLTIVRYTTDGDSSPTLERVVVRDGAATYRDRVFRATCNADGVALRGPRKR